MPDIIQRLKGAYIQNPASALALLPELFQQYDEGLIKALPCKVGDTVYILFDKMIDSRFRGWSHEEREAFNGKIVKDEIDGLTYEMYFQGRQIIMAHTKTGYHFVWDDEADKNVFLVSESAEAALRSVNHENAKIYSAPPNLSQE